MSSHENSMNAAGVLPVVLAIGFTGHRTLPDEAECRRWVHALLAEKKSSIAKTLCGVSSIASGADLLFAESCIALRIPLRVLLPLPLEEFRKDFDSAAWSRAEQVMKDAISVEVVGSKDASRDERYYECGLETVLQSQLLIAVWNGQPAQGLGGTGEIVEFAGQMDRDVFWIHSTTGAVQISNRQELRALKSDLELNFLNELPIAGGSPSYDSPIAIAEAWLAKLDSNAVRVAPQVRRLAALPIVLTALAAFISGAVLHRHAAALWAAIGGALGAAAAVLPTALGIGKRQALWVRIRTAAEVSRSVLALWEMPARYKVVGPGILTELSGMLLALDLLKSQASRTNDAGVEQFKEKYLQTRLLHQKAYFHKQTMQAARKARKYRTISKVSIAVAVLLSAWTFVGGYFTKTPHEGSFISLAAAALFQLATVAAALLVVHDCDRRQLRYQEIYQTLASWEKELCALHTWHPVSQVVDRIEGALLVELLEWRSLLQNMKMPRY